MAWHTLLAAAGDVPARAAAWLRTNHYRRAVALDPTSRVLPPGRILNPGGRHDAVDVGANTVLRGELFVFPHAGRIRIGKWCFVGEESRIWSSADVWIGDRVLISHQVNIHDTNGHPISAVSRHRHFREIQTTGHPPHRDDIAARPIRIGDDVWVGFGASILKGVQIGEGAIVAAASVVCGDVAPWTLVAGNPARVVKDIASE